MINWTRFVEVVRAAKSFVLVSHIRPDCDALGSELGMCGVLEALGKQVTICNGQATPPNLAFIDPAKKVRAINVDLKPEQLQGTDVIMILDTSAWAQLGPMGDVIRASTAKKIVLDHHMSEDDLGAEQFKDVTAEATGRLVYDAARELGVTLTAEIAMPLFAAVATDTGWFRFGSTSATTLNCAAGLITAGAKPAQIYAWLYEQMTLAKLKLQGRTLAATQSEMDGRLVHTRILREDFEATGALPSDTEDLINLTLQVAGTEAAAILVEQASGEFKVSFRSRGKVDCSKVAEQFKGGGHKAAAGATVPGPFAEAQAKVLDAIKAAMR